MITIKMDPQKLSAAVAEPKAKTEEAMPGAVDSAMIVQQHEDPQSSAPDMEQPRPDNRDADGVTVISHEEIVIVPVEAQAEVEPMTAAPQQVDKHMAEAGLDGPGEADYPAKPSSVEQATANLEAATEREMSPRAADSTSIIRTTDGAVSNRQGREPVNTEATNLQRQPSNATGNPTNEPFKADSAHGQSDERQVKDEAEEPAVPLGCPFCDFRGHGKGLVEYGLTKHADVDMDTFVSKDVGSQDAVRQLRNILQSLSADHVKVILAHDRLKLKNRKEMVDVPMPRCASFSQIIRPYMGSQSTSPIRQQLSSKSQVERQSASTK
jgi:hypothetical protein